ncbi:MAG: hypothetical protein RQ723_05835 [Desulfuromonadales bacterium]|nr:hypothetical protein [Desulfuromonadales bacterium]
MNTMYRLLIICLTFGLFACAPVTPPEPAGPTVPPPDQLPGATITAGPPLEVVYPAASLFPAGAVLPDAGGLDALEALAEWLKKTPGSRWQVAVWQESNDTDSLARAEKRLALLQRFMTRKGLNVERWQWLVGEPGGDQLRLVTLADSP